MQLSLDQKQYKESDLISIKIPFNFPYVIRTTVFEDIEGNIEINGINYQYVKRRVYNGTLEILCVPNYTKTSINAFQNNFAKQLNDTANAASSKKSSNNQIVKLSISDYVQDHYFNIHSFISLSNHSHGSYDTMIFSVDFLQGVEQPPEA